MVRITKPTLVAPIFPVYTGPRNQSKTQYLDKIAFGCRSRANAENRNRRLVRRTSDEEDVFTDYSLSEKVLEEYPGLSGTRFQLSKRVKLKINSVYSNNRVIKRFIEEGKKDITYHLKLVTECLERLMKENIPECDGFIQKETWFLEKNKSRC